MLPGNMVPQMGRRYGFGHGRGAKCVIMAMRHTAKGTPMILKTCWLPSIAT
jgi:acyl CoA:acetate/3-ketoacid CoA transferase beta subunit